MKIHPAAEIFPRMNAEEYKALKADIATHGVREAVWTHKGMLLDGRHRRQACAELGIECPAREYDGDDPVAFVVSLNLNRRHLSDDQRRMVAARIATMPRGRPDENAQIAHIPTQDEAAALLNVDRRGVQRARVVIQDGAPELVQAVESGAVSVSAAADVAQLPKAEQAGIVARGEREILEAAKQIRAGRAEQRRAERVENLRTLSQQSKPLDGVGRFPVLYCDPPWRYEHVETESRAIENQYPTMALEDICRMPIETVALDDCVLFMWATSPKLAEAMQVLSAWGFSYRSCAVWDKEVIGMGYYFRQQHELLLVATRGEPPTPAPADRAPSVIRARREEHSKKPVVVYDLIEAMYPTLPRLELFARASRQGWDAWGFEAAAA